jgi:hypothetical protein
MASRNLHNVSRAIAGRKLHDTEPVAARIEAHRLGVDRNRGADVARQVRKIASVPTDGHKIIL